MLNRFYFGAFLAIADRLSKTGSKFLKTSAGVVLDAFHVDVEILRDILRSDLKL